MQKQECKESLQQQRRSRHYKEPPATADMPAIAEIPAKCKYPSETDGTHCGLKEAEDESSTFYDRNLAAIRPCLWTWWKIWPGFLVNRPAKKLHSAPQLWLLCCQMAESSAACQKKDHRTFLRQVVARFCRKGLNFFRESFLLFTSFSILIDCYWAVL